MDEYIERAALIARCKEIADCDWNKKAAPVSWAYAYEQFADEVEEQPAADVVEIPDCTKCAHHADIEDWDFCEHCIGNTYRNNNFVSKEACESAQDQEG